MKIYINHILEEYSFNIGKNRCIMVSALINDFRSWYRNCIIADVCYFNYYYVGI